MYRIYGKYYVHTSGDNWRTFMVQIGSEVDKLGFKSNQNQKSKRKY